MDDSQKSRQLAEILYNQFGAANYGTSPSGGGGGGGTVGGSTEATLLQVRDAIKAQIDLASSVWTDNSGAYYVRRDLVNEGTGVITVSFTDSTGTAATPGAGLKPLSSSSKEVLQTVFDAISSGTGYASGDILGRIQILDPNVASPTVAVFWVNITQGTNISAPTAGTYEQALETINSKQSGVWNINNISGSLALPTGASTENTLALVKAKTDNLDVALSTRTKPADVQNISTQTDKSNSGTLGVQDATLVIATNGSGTVIAEITGTWVGTVIFEGSNNGFTTQQAITSIFLGGIQTQSATTTANGFFSIVCAGFAQVRCRMNSYTSGTATVLMNASSEERIIVPLQGNPNNLQTLSTQGPQGTPANSWFTKKVDVGGVNVQKVDANGAARMYNADPNSTNVNKWSPKQYPYVELDPISLFYDGFSGALDTVDKWTTGGIAPTSGIGNLNFNAGTAANAASYLYTKYSFPVVASVFNRGGALVTLPSGAETGSKAWWGFGIPAGSPTMAVPFTNAVVFEIKDTDGSLVGAVYSNSVRTTEVALVIPTQLSSPVLSTGRPSDGLLHRYAVNYRASKVWFEIDDVVVGSIAAPNPQIVELPITAGVINGASVLGSARTIVISTISMGDTGRNSIQLSDGALPYRKATIDSNGALRIDSSISNYGNPTSANKFIPVKNAPINRFRTSFAAVIAAGVDTNFWTLLQTGTAQTVAQSGGNLVINAQTTANSETIIRSNVSFLDAFIAKYGLIASQRIANNNLFIELVDVIGDSLVCTVNSATSITVTFPSTFVPSSQNIGQSFNLQAFNGFTGVTSVSGRYAVASIAGQNVTFTVASFATGSVNTGTCSVTGWNFHQVIYNGVTATNATYNTQRRGWSGTAQTATILTTASPGHAGYITSEDNAASFQDSLQTATTSIASTVRAMALQNIADETTPLFVQIRCVNGTSAPASNTTFTLSFVGVEDYVPNLVTIANSKNQNLLSVTPVQAFQNNAANLNMTAAIAAAQTLATVTTVATVTTLANGQTAHSAASTGSPFRIGGRVKTTNDTTLVAGDASDIACTTDQALINKPFAAPELDWTFACTAPVANTTDVVLKAAAAAGIRNYITGFQIINASATIATEVVIKDNATVIWRGYVGVGTVLNAAVGVSMLTPLRSTAATALNFACITTGSSVYVNAQGYIAS